MKILVDTHTLFWFFTASKQLSTQAKTTIENAQEIYIPTIVLLELLYLLAKKRRQRDFSLLYNELKDNDRYTIISLDVAVIEAFLILPKRLEMHDGIITATAKLLHAPIVTKDPIIQEIYKNTVW